MQGENSNHASTWKDKIVSGSAQAQDANEGDIEMEETTLAPFPQALDDEDDEVENDLCLPSG